MTGVLGILTHSFSHLESSDFSITVQFFYTCTGTDGSLHSSVSASFASLSGIWGSGLPCEVTSLKDIRKVDFFSVFGFFLVRTEWQLGSSGQREEVYFFFKDFFFLKYSCRNIYYKVK